MFPNSINGVIELLSVESKVSEIGVNELTIISKRSVPCSIKSITRLEYLSSVEISKNIEIKAVIQSFLYREEKYGIIRGTTYKIERTFLNGGFIELYLSKADLGENS